MVLCAENNSHHFLLMHNIMGVVKKIIHQNIL